MTPELREKFKGVARGTKDRPGFITAIENLKRRTQIDTSSLTVQVDKHSYPWHAVVRGTRQVVGQPPEAAQPFELELDLVRTSRDENRPSNTRWGPPGGHGARGGRAS